RALGAGQGFGGRETAQTWVAAGQRVVAQGCRREGAGRRARVRFVLADVEPPTTQGPPRLVRVRAGEDELHALERLGFDVTHDRRDGRADVVVAGDGQLARLRTLGIPFETRIADLTEAFREARAADRAYADRLGAAGTPLP